MRAVDSSHRTGQKVRHKQAKEFRELARKVKERQGRRAASLAPKVPKPADAPIRDERSVLNTNLYGHDLCAISGSLDRPDSFVGCESTRNQGKVRCGVVSIGDRSIRSTKSGTRMPARITLTTNLVLFTSFFSSRAISSLKHKKWETYATVSHVPSLSIRS